MELIKEETMKIVPQEWINHLLLFRNKSGIFCVHYAHGQSKVYVSTMLGEETEDLPADVLLTELLSFTVRHPPTALYYSTTHIPSRSLIANPLKMKIKMPL